MKTQAIHFNNIVERIFELPLEEKLEIKNLLEHNIAESKRDEIAGNYAKAQEEHLTGKLQFSKQIDALKKQL